MVRAKRDEFLRHEPKVRRKVTTQRNLKVPPRPGDDEETFGAVSPKPSAPMQSFEMRDSAIVSVPRDRTPKGVNDGRGKRSVKDVLMSTPTPEGKAIYAMERLASLEDQMVKILELMGKEAREIVFKRRSWLKRYWED